jgi:hypothetical protein
MERLMKTTFRVSVFPPGAVIPDWDDVTEAAIIGTLSVRSGCWEITVADNGVEFEHAAEIRSDISACTRIRSEPLFHLPVCIMLTRARGLTDNLSLGFGNLELPNIR